MTFRDRLIATIHAARPVLESPGVLVIGSEVPNLLEKSAAATSPRRAEVTGLFRALETGATAAP